MKKLDENPDLLEAFAKRSLDDPDFFAAVQKGDLSKLDELLNIADFERTTAINKADPNTIPKGTKTEIPENASIENKRSLTRENESAEILAKNGYEVEQNPKIPGTNKNPDYLINGKVFDNYAPKTDNPLNVISNINKKVLSGQTTRVVLNLDDCPIDLNILKTQLKSTANPGLQEVIAIKNGVVMHIYP